MGVVFEFEDFGSWAIFKLQRLTIEYHPYLTLSWDRS